MNVLPTLRERFPHKAAEYVAVLETQLQDRNCLTEVLEAARTLSNEGFKLPTYVDLAERAKPAAPDPQELDPGEWRHGWQYHASSAREADHRRNRVLPRLTTPERALLRSQAGRNYTRALTAVPPTLLYNSHLQGSTWCCAEDFAYLFFSRRSAVKGADAGLTRMETT